MRTTVLQNGRSSKSINVSTDSAVARDLVLRFSVDVEAPVLIKPFNRLVVNSLEGEEGSARVLLHRNDGEALVVVRAASGDPHLVVRAVPVTKASEPEEFGGVPGDQWLEMVVVPEAPVGARAGTIRIEIDHPDVSTLEVPYSTRVRPLIEARPEEIRLWTGSVAEGRKRSITVNLINNRGREFLVTGVEVSHPELFSAAAFGGRSVQQTLRVAVLDDIEGAAPAGTVEGWVDISTDDPERPKLRLPVVVSPSRTRRPAAG
jgi:hypothetical protein